MVGTQLFDFEQSYADAVPAMSVEWSAQPFPNPQLLVLNSALAGELGVEAEALSGPDGAQLLVGQLPAGARTFAQVYAGHQFGSWVPRLGDGRALLLGEVIDTQGRRRDLQLKGSGRTPFARGADGKAVLGPMLREYLIGEALHGLGIPTTRALSVSATGELVLRDLGELPGAVLCRVASSHLRVGTFQYAAALGEPHLRSLADYAIWRHYPDCAEAGNPYLEFLIRVVEAQADLVSRWMLVGFVHGVMNTDNMTISGESIDFGPCAFMDAYDPAAVFSSIDRHGRYAYGQQPLVAQWNLARLAECLLPLIDERPEGAVEAALDAVRRFVPRYQQATLGGFSAKLGLAEPNADLVSDILELMRTQQVDYTRFFRALATDTAGELFQDRSTFNAWAMRRQMALGRDHSAVTAGMSGVNPAYIPRNHLVEHALEQATRGDMAPFRRLVDAVSHPFVERIGWEDLTVPGPLTEYVTYCGT